MNLIWPFLAAVTLLQGTDTGLIEEFDTDLDRTGFIKLADTPAELLGPEAAAEISHVIFADELVQWRAYLPKDYSPKKPPGILVFVSTDDFGGIPSRWMSLMDEENLIWVSPLFAGSEIPVEERILKAVLAPHAVDTRYGIDSRRVYIGGYANGGQVASLVQAANPETFRGSLYVCGAMPLSSGAPGKRDLMKENRHVFIGGCGDRDEREMRRVHKEYLQAGIDNASLIIIDLQRGLVPQRRYIKAGIKYLDSDEETVAD